MANFIVNVIELVRAIGKIIATVTQITPLLEKGMHLLIISSE